MKGPVGCPTVFFFSFVQEEYCSHHRSVAAAGGTAEAASQVTVITDPSGLSVA